MAEVAETVHLQLMDKVYLEADKVAVGEALESRSEWG
jgi:hypothetical protein